MKSRNCATAGCKSSAAAANASRRMVRSEEHTSELQSRQYLHSFPTRRSSDLFPCPLEPYVMDEITELRHRGVQVVCCSGKRVSQNGLSPAERAFWKETRYFQPLSDDELVRALGRFASNRHNLWQLLRPLVWERGASPARRIRALGHTVMGARLAEHMAPLEVEHIHAHHGYFASWMALTAARLLGIGFSFTLHGSDLLQRADLLSAK